MHQRQHRFIFNPLVSAGLICLSFPALAAPQGTFDVSVSNAAEMATSAPGPAQGTAPAHSTCSQFAATQTASISSLSISNGASGTVYNNGCGEASGQGTVLDVYSGGYGIAYDGAKLVLHSGASGDAFLGSTIIVEDGASGVAHDDSYAKTGVFAGDRTRLVGHDRSSIVLKGQATGYVDGDATGEAFEQSFLIAHDSSHAYFHDQAKGTMLDQSKGWGDGHSSVTAWDKTHINMSGDGSAVVREFATATISEKASGYGHDHSTLDLHGNALGEIQDQSTGEFHDDSSGLVMGNASAKGFDSSRLVLYNHGSATTDSEKASITAGISTELRY